jgi:hypothetical protein
MNSLNVKNISLLNSFFEWISSLHSLIFVSIDSIICDEAIFAWFHSRRKNIVKMTIVIHDCECLSSCEKSCVFHTKHACFRIINREIDHFDRFKIEIKFFVRFFLKFIENDRLSWMKNAVNSDWWMRKWVVNKTKMRRWVIFNLKNCFFLSFLFKHFLLFIHLSFFFQTIFKKFWNFSSCHLCKNVLFFLTSSNSIVFFRIRWKSFSIKKKISNAVNAVSNFWRWSLFLNAFLMLIDRFAIVVRL